LQTYIYPGRTVYRSFDNQPVSLIPITTFGLTDLYVYLNDWTGASQATINVFVNPLVPLVWYGGLVMLVGGILCWWPQRRRSVRAAHTAATQTVKPAPSSDIENEGVVV